MPSSCGMIMRGKLPIIAANTSCFLDKIDLITCIRLARERQDANERGRTQNRNYSARTDVDIHLQGLLGEVAFCRLFELEDQTGDTTCCSHTRDRFDASIDDYQVDVKTTIAIGNGILAPAWKSQNPADALVLMYLMAEPQQLQAWLNPNTNQNSLPSRVALHFMGFIAAEDLYQPHYLNQPGPGQGKGYYCKAGELRAFHDMCHRLPATLNPFPTPRPRSSMTPSSAGPDRTQPKSLPTASVTSIKVATPGKKTFIF